jgi:hypothetical protein
MAFGDFALNCSDVVIERIACRDIPLRVDLDLSKGPLLKERASPQPQVHNQPTTTATTNNEVEIETDETKYTSERLVWPSTTEAIAHVRSEVKSRDLSLPPCR